MPFLISLMANKILPCWLADFCGDLKRIGGMAGGRNWKIRFWMGCLDRPGITLVSYRVVVSKSGGFLFTWHIPLFHPTKKTAIFISPAALIPNYFGFDKGGTGIIIIMDHSGVLESGQDAQFYELLRPAG